MEAPTTPPRPIERREANTIKRTRFFEAYDRKSRSDTIKSIALQHDIRPRTAEYWLRQRRIQGSPAFRRTRKQSTRLGRNYILTKPQL